MEKTDTCERLRALPMVKGVDVVYDKIRLWTAFQYPDGGDVDLYITDDIWSDCGQTLTNFNLAYGVAYDPSTISAVSRTAEAYGVELKGAVLTLSKPRKDQSEAVLALGQACLIAAGVLYSELHKPAIQKKRTDQRRASLLKLQGMRARLLNEPNSEEKFLEAAMLSLRSGDVIEGVGLLLDADNPVAAQAVLELTKDESVLTALQSSESWECPQFKAAYERLRASQYRSRQWTY